MSAQHSQDPQGSGGGAIVAIGLGLVIIVVAIVLVMNIDTGEKSHAEGENGDHLKTSHTNGDGDHAKADSHAKPASQPGPASAPKADEPAKLAASEDAKTDETDSNSTSDAAEGGATEPAPAAAEAGEAASNEEMVELELELPNPAFAGTPKEIPTGTRMKPPTGKDRPPFFVPKGIKLLSADAPVTSSDDNIFIGSVEMVTDGDKEPLDGRWVELAPGLQWVQIDLEKQAEILVIVVWHQHLEAKVYRDVIVQVSDDPEFKKGVTTVFNNDYDNSAKMGEGKDFEYFENYEGLLIDCAKTVDGKKVGVKGRYVRCYSNGSTSDPANHYTEVEAWGRPIGE